MAESHPWVHLGGQELRLNWLSIAKVPNFEPKRTLDYSDAGVFAIKSGSRINFIPGRQAPFFDF
jgi:hypothetical protein